MNELTRKALVDQAENIIADYNEKELSDTEWEGLNGEELECISECLQFGQYKNRIVQDYTEIRNKAIYEFGDRLKYELMRKYENATPAEQDVVTQVLDWCYEITELMKNRINTNAFDALEKMLEQIVNEKQNDANCQ